MKTPTRPAVPHASPPPPGRVRCWLRAVFDHDILGLMATLLGAVVLVLLLTWSMLVILPPAREAAPGGLPKAPEVTGPGRASQPHCFGGVENLDTESLFRREFVPGLPPQLRWVPRFPFCAEHLPAHRDA